MRPWGSAKAGRWRAVGYRNHHRH